MTPLAYAVVTLFIAAWCIAAAGWLYGTRFYLPIWAAEFQNAPEPEGYRRKAFRGYAVFVGAVLFAFVIGGVAQWAGGWQSVPVE